MMQGKRKLSTTFAAEAEKRARVGDDVMTASNRNSNVVCNVKVKFIRPKWNNLKDWCGSPSNVYIGRSGVVFVDGVRFPPKESEWANPFKIGKDGERDEVLRKFNEFMSTKLASDPAKKGRLQLLRNKNLGCWCVDAPTSDYSEHALVCHGQILLKLIDEMDEEPTSPGSDVKTY